MRRWWLTPLVALVLLAGQVTAAQAGAVYCGRDPLVHVIDASGVTRDYHVTLWAPAGHQNELNAASSPIEGQTFYADRHNRIEIPVYVAGGTQFDIIAELTLNDPGPNAQPGGPDVLASANGSSNDNFDLQYSLGSDGRGSQGEHGGHSSDDNGSH